MKIAVINFSGNVGKSTVARHLLAPRLDDPRSSQSNRSTRDGNERGALRGNQFDELQDQLMTLRNAVVDIGASNVEDFVSLMQSYDGSHEDFDLFVVPTVPTMKQQVDTIATLRALSADIRCSGVPESGLCSTWSIRGETSRKCFAKVFEAHEDDRGFMLLNATRSSTRTRFSRRSRAFDKIDHRDRATIPRTTSR